MNHVELSKIIVGLAANFGVKIPVGLIELWKAAFMKDGISIDQIRYGAGKILRTKKDGYGRMPTYAEIIEIIQGGDKKDKALVLATEIITHLKLHGANVLPVLEDPVAANLMSRRWPYRKWAAQVLESELKWWTKEFCEAYKSHTAIEKLLENNLGKKHITRRRRELYNYPG